VTPQTPFASPARAVRIDGDERAPLESQFRQVLAEAAAKLMTRSEGLMDDGRPDAAILVVVQVAPAYSNRRYVDEVSSGPPSRKLIGATRTSRDLCTKTASFMEGSAPRTRPR
jgi:hypothetical protein